MIPALSFTPAQRERLIRVFRALGDGTRLEVYRLIAAQTTAICVCDIVTNFQLSQPTISHHLKILREAGLVSVSRRGVWAYYTARNDELALVRTLMDESTRAELASAR
ncbi:MAG: ArsR/SmtB family transcription factor [Chloroflexota bacterium]